MHIFKPWKKDVQSCIKIGMKLYPLSIYFHRNGYDDDDEKPLSENDKVHKVEKETKLIQGL